LAADASQSALRRLVELVDISVPTASPDGRLVAFRTEQASVERNSYLIAWHVLDTAGGPVRRIADGGEPIVEEPGLVKADPPIWSPDGRWIYYRALRAGAVQIWRAAADGSGAEVVTSEEGDVLLLERAPDGAILYRVGPSRSAIEQAELAEYDSGILVDRHVELGQNVFRGAIVHGRRATQRLNGSWFSRGSVLWWQAPRQRRLDLRSLRSSDAEPGGAAAPGGEARPEVLARSAAGDVATASWGASGSDLSVARAGALGGTVECRLEACRTDRIAWAAFRSGHDQLVFATMDRALVQSLRLWDLRTGAVRTILRGNGLMNGGREEGRPCAVLGDRAVCVVADPRTPPRLEAVNLETGACRAASSLLCCARSNWRCRSSASSRATLIAAAQAAKVTRISATRSSSFVLRVSTKRCCAPGYRDHPPISRLRPPEGM
jgi:hypothetical protein